MVSRFFLPVINLEYNDFAQLSRTVHAVGDSAKAQLHGLNWIGVYNVQRQYIDNTIINGSISTKEWKYDIRRTLSIFPLLIMYKVWVDKSFDSVKEKDNV